MNAPTREELARSGTLEELYGKLTKVGMGAGWNKPTPSLWTSPRKTFQPTHWSYAQARGALDAAGRLINTELAERRNLILFNPAEGNTYATVRTLVAAYQMIMPGEWARVHRHTPNALRLILDAESGTYTEVDGVNIGMEPGDVLLTPNWSTHGHGNNSKSNAYWLDVLDAPLTSDNFITLARRGYFDGLTFHRVVPDFVVQGGDPRGDGEGGPGYTIRDELNQEPYLRGTVGMALAWRDTGGSQFFITHGPQPHLDARYTVFGRVVAGLEVVDAITQWDVVRRIRIWDGVQ